MKKMKKTKDNTQTGKNSKNERIAACIDELKHLLAMTKHEYRMLCDLCDLAHPTLSVSMRVALLASLAKDFEMLFGSYYDKVIVRDVVGSTVMDSDESLNAIIEHMQNQIVDYMSIRGGVVSKPEVMFVFGESDITRDAIDGLIDDEKIDVVNGELTMRLMV